MSKTYFDSINKIWSGSEMPTIYNSNVSVGYLVLNILQNSPDEITQISYDSGIELTCRQMYQKTINIASYLQEIGCKPGDIIGFLGLNSDNFAPAVFACLYLGIPVNSLAPRSTESEIIFYYSFTKPKLIFCDAEYIKKMELIVTKLPIASEIYTVDRKVDGYKFIGDVVDRDYDPQTFIIPHFDSNSLAFILATSGTSNSPKLVCKSHKQIIEDFTAQWKSKIFSKEIWFVFTGVYWITGVWALLKCTFYGSKRIITTRAFDPTLMIKIIAKYNVTTTIMEPTAFKTLFDCGSYPLTSMKMIAVGGLAVSKRTCERANILFPNSLICHSYGSTEGDILAMNLTNTKFESVGQLYGNVEMKILNEDGVHLGVGEIGEIVYKSPVIFPGYFNNPAKTDEAIKHGWVFSGDLGYFDKDGDLFITDRKTDVIRYDSYVSAAELESIISEIDGVTQVCVVGAYREEDDDLIFAFVVSKLDSDLNEKYIEEYVNERVADYKKVRGGVHFVDSFPKTLTGKIRRLEVKKWAQEKYKKSFF